MKKTRSQLSVPALRDRSSRRRRAVRLALALLGGVLFVEAVVGDNGLMARRKADQAYRAAEQSLAADRAENERLREWARRLREDPATIEDLARRELGLIKPGEKLFILKDVPPAGASRR